MQSTSSSASLYHSSSSHTSSGPALPHTLGDLTATKFVLTIEDKKILKDRYLDDFESGDRNVRREVIGNALREVGLLRPVGTHINKGKAKKVCAMYSHV
jgi:hypothetical protein